MTGSVASDRPHARPAWAEPATALGALRSGVGVLSWVSPAASWRTFGLGPLRGSASAALITRLFGVRELVLGQAVRSSQPELRRAALRIGVWADSADVLATLLAVRAGAPRTTLVGVGAGAAVFVALGVAALREQPGQSA